MPLALSLVTPVTLSNEPSASDMRPVTSAARRLLPPPPTVSRSTVSRFGGYSLCGGVLQATSFFKTGSGLPIPSEGNFYEVMWRADLVERLILMQIQTETPAVPTEGTAVTGGRISSYGRECCGFSAFCFWAFWRSYGVTQTTSPPNASRQTYPTRQVFGP
jgi:hypothetical protein